MGKNNCATNHLVSVLGFNTQAYGYIDRLVKLHRMALLEELDSFIDLVALV
jgi:hypothetical protein